MWKKHWFFHNHWYQISDILLAIALKIFSNLYTESWFTPAKLTLLITNRRSSSAKLMQNIQRSTLLKNYCNSATYNSWGFSGPICTDWCSQLEYLYSHIYLITWRPRVEAQLWVSASWVGANGLFCLSVFCATKPHKPYFLGCWFFFLALYYDSMVAAYIFN